MWSWLFAILVIAVLVYLIFWGPAGTNLISGALLVGLILGALIWEFLLEPPEVAKREVVIDESAPPVTEIVPDKEDGSEIQLKGIPKRLSQSKAKEIGQGEAGTAYIYDDPDTTLPDLVIESNRPVSKLWYLNRDGVWEPLTIDR